MRKKLTTTVVISTLLTTFTIGSISASADQTSAPESPNGQVQPVSLAENKVLPVNNDKTQKAVDLASEYVEKSNLAWDAKVNAELTKTLAKEKLESAQVAEQAHEDAIEETEELTAIADEKKSLAAQWAREVMRNPVTNTDPSLQAFLAGPNDTKEVADTIRFLEQNAERKQHASREAYSAQQKAEESERKAEELAKEALELSDAAKAAEAEAATKEADSQQLFLDSKQKFTEASAALNNAEISAGVKSEVPASERVLMMASVDNWNTYVDHLQSLNTPLPQPDTVIEQEALETGDGEGKEAAVKGVTSEDVKPALTTANTAQPGAVIAPDGTVLVSQKAYDRVNYALSSLGTPYSALSCQAFASQAAGLEETKTLEELYTSAAQNARIEDTLPGDIVFFGDNNGLTQAGVSIGGGLVVISSAAAKSVIVAPMTANSIKSIRPGLTADPSTLEPAPARNETNGVDWQCGGITLDASISGSGMTSWILPFGDREYRLGTKYDDQQARFPEGKSSGLEFLVNNVDVVQSAVNGSVSVVENDALRGNTVIVNHSDTMSIRYSGLGKLAVVDGAYVTAGEPLGESGNTGSIMTEAPSNGVFIEVMLNGININPEFMFFPQKSQGNSGFANGQIPAEALCPIIGSHKLRCDAATAFLALNEAFKAQFGKDISITDSYRSLEAQISVKAAKPHLAAVPGTSNHGWGLALDLGGGIQTFNTAEHMWMQANAPVFGWDNPSWARANGSKPEAWHWEYVIGVS